MCCVCVVCVVCVLCVCVGGGGTSTTFVDDPTSYCARIIALALVCGFLFVLIGAAICACDPMSDQRRLQARLATDVLSRVPAHNREPYLGNPQPLDAVDMSRVCSRCRLAFRPRIFLCGAALAVEIRFSGLLIDFGVSVLGLFFLLFFWVGLPLPLFPHLTSLSSSSRFPFLTLSLSRFLSFSLCLPPARSDQRRRSTVTGTTPTKLSCGPIISAGRCCRITKYSDFDIIFGPFRTHLSARYRPTRAV